MHGAWWRRGGERSYPGIARWCFATQPTQSRRAATGEPATASGEARAPQAAPLTAADAGHLRACTRISRQPLETSRARLPSSRSIRSPSRDRAPISRHYGGSFHGRFARIHHTARNGRVNRHTWERCISLSGHTPRLLAGLEMSCLPACAVGASRRLNRCSTSWCTARRPRAGASVPAATLPSQLGERERPALSEGEAGLPTQGPSKASSSSPRAAADRTAARRARRGSPHSGSRTLSMTWMTPLVAGMSAWVTVAFPTMTFPPVVAMVSSWPFTVLADFSVATCSELTFPGTTW